MSQKGKACLPLFNPNRLPESEKAKGVVEDVTAQLLNLETHLGTRKRPRRAADAARFKSTVSAVTSDQVYRRVEGREGTRMSLDKARLSRNSRYRNKAVINEHLPVVLDLMSRPEVAFLEVQKGYRSQFGNQLTVIRPGPRLLSRITDMSVLDYTESARQEIVILKDTKVSTRNPADFLEYTDTEVTNQYRTEVRTINAHLADAEVEYMQDVAEDGFVVDDRVRSLTRSFTRASFCSGGRLFGGFWQPIGKTERLSNTLISGEHVVSLDFASMGAALAYAYARVQPPSGDLYPAVGKIPRATMKRLLAACMFADKPLMAWPRKLAATAQGVTVSAAVSALTEAHPALAPLFFRGLGHLMQYTESEILVDILLMLISKGITALPVHDAIVVAESDHVVAREVMLQAFTFHTGHQVEVSAESAN